MAFDQDVVGCRGVQGVMDAVVRGSFVIQQWLILQASLQLSDRDRIKARGWTTTVRLAERMCNDRCQECEDSMS